VDPYIIADEVNTRESGGADATEEVSAEVGNASRRTFVVTGSECRHGDRRKFPNLGLISSIIPCYKLLASIDQKLGN
jgi:hypothetical protein